MPPTPLQKAPETKKSFYEQSSDVEAEKVELVEADLILVDSTSRPTGGAGESPVKKVLKKSTKVEDDKTGKKINAAIIDKIPKKNAQRAKGSISLNKTIEKTGAELTEKKRLGFNSSDSVTATKEEDKVDSTKSSMEGRRTPVSVRNKGSKTKTITKKPAKKNSKDSKSKNQKPWMDAVKNSSSNALEKKITAEAIEKENFAEAQNADILPLDPPFATCSFFEKLQQGVKSYFSSKNSFTSCDKNKKEGGSQNSASVANGVKEDAKKRIPGFILKNDICNSESDLFLDELRSNSNLGGQLNNFSNNKPKIFRKLKRKKIYHPKKQYVRIQIPRKGYFYRSSTQFKTPGSPTSGQLQRLEPLGVSKSKSKIQIPRLASTSSKITNLSNKKGLTAKQENFEKGSNLDSVLSDDCFSFEFLDQLNSALNDKKSGCGFEQKVKNSLVLDCPNEYFLSPERKKLPLKDDKTLELVNSELKREKQTNAISKRLLRSGSQKAIDRVKKKSLSVKNQFSENSDLTTERLLPTFKKKQKTTSESTLDTLVNCIHSTLGKDKFFYDLEITPISSIKEDMSKTCADPKNLQGFAETPLQFTEIIGAFNNFNYSTVAENPAKSETLYLSPVSPTPFYQPFVKPIASLMEEIDLHLELQNYLEGYNNFAKSKAKSTQENNFKSSINCPKEKNKFSEVKESKSSSSFASAISDSSLENESENQFRVFLDRKLDMISLSEECLGARSPRIFSLQTKFENESREIRKIKSENNPRTFLKDSKLNSSIKRTFGKTSFPMLSLSDKENLTLRHLLPVSKDLSAKESVGSYEKIKPFDISSNKSCSETRTRNKSSVLPENHVYSLSAESVAQRVWKAVSDMNYSQSKSPNNFKTVEPDRSTLCKESAIKEMILPPNFQPVSNLPKWSPTLQDLIEIYNSVLKQNRKIRRNSKNSISNCFSSHLLTFLNEKLQEKQTKANLISFSKDFTSKYKPPKSWKLLKKKENSVRLKEYVAMFQEILQSSLSISQISRLNNIISGLQDHPQNDNISCKDIKNAIDAELETKKNLPLTDKFETAPKIYAFGQPNLISQTKPKECLLNETMKTSKTSNALSEIRSRTAENLKSKKKKTKSKEKIHESELSSLPELENLLKTCFDSADVFSEDPEKMDTKDKLLLSVKVSENRISVNSLSYFNNEDAVSSQKTKQEGTSELIIESVTGDQVKDVLNKSAKINRLKQVKSSHDNEAPNKSDRKLKKSKPSEAKKSQKHLQAKVKKIVSESKYEREYLQQHNRSPETAVPFEYNQMQLRSQHPIEAIIESSESKLSEIFENPNKDKSEFSSLFKDIHNDSMIMKEALKDALAENVFTKDLICNFDWSEEEIGKTLSPIKSNVIRRQSAKRRGTPFAKKQQILAKVKSTSDLNSRTCRKRKGRKALLARLRNTYLCYPFLQNSKVKSLKSLQKSKDKIKDKSLTSTSPRSAAKNSTQTVTKPELHKKLSENFGFKRQKEVTAIKSQIPDPKVTSMKEVTSQSSNTVLYFNNKDISDCCSIELLLSENANNSYTLSVSGISTKQDRSVQTASEQIPCPNQFEDSNSNNTTEAALNKTKDSPIVLHPASNDIDDLSFPSMIIHSDSFLKCFSGFAITKSKLESLFRSDSEMKFYPGRISKQGRESKPFVQFVLTPEQKKMAVHSSDKIYVVTKPKTALSSTSGSTLASTTNDVSGPYITKEEKETTEVKSNKSSDTISFQSVEKLYKFKKSQKTAGKKITAKKLEEKSQLKQIKKLKQISSSCSRRKKSLLFSQISPNVDAIDRKPYHECQKKKKLARIEREAKTLIKMSEKLKENQKRKIKVVEREGKPVKSDAFFPNKVKYFIKALEIFENSNEENEESKTCGKKEKISAAEAKTFNETSCQTFTDDAKDTATPKINLTDDNAETEAKGRANTNPTQINSNFFSELLEVLKTAFTQVDNFKNKADTISIIEKELEKKKPKLCEMAVAICESFGKTLITPGKLNTVKIKIYFPEPKSTIESKKAEKLDQNLQTEKTDLLEEVRSRQVFSHEPATREVDMLNSLLLREEVKGGGLEKRNSTYFDALEKTLQDEIGEAEKEMGDIQRKYQRFSEGISDLNARFGVKEAKSQHHPLLTPSDEKLLFNDCFTKESEEAIIVKITKALNEDKISYSTALLEEFLKKAENSPNLKDICSRLRQMLMLVENKSRNLMISMEKKAWLKVLSSLEELSQAFENENIEGSMRSQLKMTKTFIDKIKALNVNSLVDLQNFCFALSQQSTAMNDRNHIGEFFRNICESLNVLKQKFILKRSYLSKAEILRDYENRNQDNESRFRVHSTVSLPEICKKTGWYKEKNQMEYLKRKIKQQKISIEHLMEHDRDSVPQDFEDVKNEVAKKMKLLEKMLELCNLG